METFLISPDDCLILKAFKETNSLREAAILLGQDPAGLTRRVQQISNQYGYIQKINNRWQVTARGLDLIAWVESIIQSQKKILQGKDGLRLASTMWFAEEILIPNVLNLKKIFKEDLNISISVPKNDLEMSLIDGSVDYVIVCHPPENPEIEHRQIAEEKWVLVAPIQWKKFILNNKENIFNYLKDKPFIRHSDLNHDLFLPNFADLKQSDIQIDNFIGIRSAVCAGIGWSLVPKILIERSVQEEQIFQIPYDIAIHDRKICIWWLRNRYEIKRHSVKMVTWLKEIFIK